MNYLQGIFIGLISTLLLFFLNKVLQQLKLSVISPEMMIGFDILKIRKNRKLCQTDGFLTLLLSGTASGILFTFLYEIISLDAYILGLIYSMTIWLILMFIILPAVHRGFLGLKFHKQVPFSSLVLLGTYGILLGFLINI